jgi:hypothetical protein
MSEYKRGQIKNAVRFQCTGLLAVDKVIEISNLEWIKDIGKLRYLIEELSKNQKS